MTLQWVYFFTIHRGYLLKFCSLHWPIVKNKQKGMKVFGKNSCDRTTGEAVGFQKAGGGRGRQGRRSGEDRMIPGKEAVRTENTGNIFRRHNVRGD